MKLQFTKMHGLGNDFIVINGIYATPNLNAALISRLAQRNTGIGFDQCLLISASKHPSIDFFYRIFNANGQEVGQCVNGARCIARFITYYGLTNKLHFEVATFSTHMHLTVNIDDSVTVRLASPNLSPGHPYVHLAHPALKATKINYQLTLNDGSTHSLFIVDVGNPHAIYLVNALDTVNINYLGKAISEHLCFPEGINVIFMQLITQKQIALRVYERGCGETLACGSAAVAAAAIAILFYNSDNNLEINLRGGNLIVEWLGIGNPIYLSGPANFVYEGTLMF